MMAKAINLINELDKFNNIFAQMSYEEYLHQMKTCPIDKSLNVLSDHGEILNAISVRILAR